MFPWHVSFEKIAVFCFARREFVSCQLARPGFIGFDVRIMLRITRTTQIREIMNIVNFVLIGILFVWAAMPVDDANSKHTS